VRFLDKFLVVRDQPIVVLEDGPPCRHCRGRKKMELAEHLVSWVIPLALIVYAGEDVGAVCLECLSEVRAKETASFSSARKA